MTLTTCRECGTEVSTEAQICPHCGVAYPWKKHWDGTGRDWKSETTLFGYPLVNIAYGRDAQGRRRVAKGIIAIGQFGMGIVNISQFGIGVFSLAQFTVAGYAIAQFGIAYQLIAQIGLYIDKGYGQIVGSLVKLLSY